MEAAPSVAAAASGGGDIEAARVLLCGLLQKYSATKAMPSSGKVVVLDTELSVRHAFWAIYDNGLNCAVAWDAKRRAYVGMLTYSDFMDVLRFLYRTAHADGVGAHGPAAVAAAIATVTTYAPCGDLATETAATALAATTDAAALA